MSNVKTVIDKSISFRFRNEEDMLRINSESSDVVGKVATVDHQTSSVSKRGSKMMGAATVSTTVTESSRNSFSFSMKNESTRMAASRFGHGKFLLLLILIRFVVF